jgi:hypothetical protein
LKQLHLALDDPTHPPPLEWVVSRVCEEFGCLPTRALWELEHEPDGLALTIIKLRAYAATKAAIDRATDEKEIPKGALADLVLDVTTELVKERVQRRVQERLAKVETED